MKFVWLNKVGVASDAGFVLQSVDRYAWEYREGDHVMRLEGESFVTDAGDYGFGFYVSSHGFPGWQPPHDSVSLSQKDRDRIMDNIKQAMTFMNILTRFE